MLVPALGNVRSRSLSLRVSTAEVRNYFVSEKTRTEPQPAQELEAYSAGIQGSRRSTRYPHCQISRNISKAMIVRK